MKLVKRTVISVDGFEGNRIKSDQYLLYADLETPKDDDVVTQEQVVENDRGVFGKYSVHTDLGPISIEEIVTLKKFGIL
jgi:hypothetical protein